MIRTLMALLAVQLATAEPAVHEVVAPNTPVRLSVLSRHETGIFALSAAEVLGYSAATRRLFVTNAARNRIDVLSLRPSGALVALPSISLAPYGVRVNSLAVSGGFLVVAMEARDPQQPGRVVVFSEDGEYRTQVTVGAMPDMLTFSPDGRWLLVANEGEPTDDYRVDPEGSVAVIDCSRGPAALEQKDVRIADFRAFTVEQLDPRIRILGPGASVAQDLEPEYIAISPDSRTAFVTLQENNAVAVIDIAQARVRELLPLGSRDCSQPGLGLDPSDKDGQVAIASWPVEALYQPDAIASYAVGNQVYFVTANEGDPRVYGGFDEQRRLARVPWADEVDDRLLALHALGRLKVSVTAHPKLQVFGARSFSIWTAAGALVFDSAEDFERITADALGYECFNRDHEDDGVERRSDDRGPEPEGITLGRVGDRTLAFIGLERVGGVMMYDVSTPRRPRFLQYINPRDCTGDPAAGTANDLGPEGLEFIPAADSPTGAPLLAVANEVSGSVTLYRVIQTPHREEESVVE